jgi:hemolysin activation/secretion protein
LSASGTPFVAIWTFFVSWLGQAQRVELLSGDHLLIVQADLQLTPDSLLPSEQFVIGGAQSVRGYRQNVRSGDNAFRFSIEDRITVERNASGVPKIQLSPFVDLGVVWNDLDNPNELPNQRWLLGTGVGLL